MQTKAGVPKALFIPVSLSAEPKVTDGALRQHNVTYSTDASAEVRNQTVPHTNNNGSSRLGTDESIEENYWAAAMAEVESSKRRPGVWAKAFSEADGDLTKANAAYIKARFQQMHGLAQAEAAKLASQQSGEAVKTKAIALAKQRGIDEVIKYFLDAGTISEANLKLLIYQQDLSKTIHMRDMIRGNTLLHVCAASGMLDEVRALLVAGASPNEPNDQGWLPYHMTMNADIRSLLDKGFKTTATLLMNRGRSN